MLYEERAIDAFAIGDYTVAINFYSLAINKDPNNSSLYSSRARAFYHRVQQLDISQANGKSWKKILDDCTIALNKNSNNYDALYYRGLYEIELKKEFTTGLEILIDAYKRSLGHAKAFKHYSLPQEIYQNILKTRILVKEREIELNLQHSHPLFSKLMSRLEGEYHTEIQKAAGLSLQSRKDKVSRLSLLYHQETKDLIRIFSNSSNHALNKYTLEPPDHLTDPISLTIFHDPVTTPSGQSYEKSWLFQHLENHLYDPLTRLKLTREQCYPNLNLKMCVDEYLELHAKYTVI